jgi:hypothetical protein
MRKPANRRPESRVRENRKHGSKGGEGNRPDPYREGRESNIKRAGMEPTIRRMIKVVNP